jgi:NDP-sugar pyrophosphorylase family protein
MQIVVPMAGEGRRFVDVGYRVPKPLIPVGRDGEPMVVRVVRDLPEASRVVLLVRREHLDGFDAEVVLRKWLHNVVIVPVERLTEGQACTVALAAGHLSPEEPVLVGACDSTHVYDRARFAGMTGMTGMTGTTGEKSAKGPDCVVWTYRGDPRTALNPRSYGWVRVGEDGRVGAVSCKKPISDRPLEDHVVSGFFWFRTAAEMLGAIDALVASGERINNEFYMDVVPNILLARGLDVRVFEADKCVCWGTPADFRDFQKWERYFVEHGAEPGAQHGADHAG